MEKCIACNFIHICHMGDGAKRLPLLGGPKACFCVIHTQKKSRLPRLAVCMQSSNLFWGGGISEILTPKLDVILKHLPTATRQERERGLYNVLMSVSVWACGCVRAYMHVCVCDTERQTDRWGEGVCMHVYIYLLLCFVCFSLNKHVCKKDGFEWALHPGQPSASSCCNQTWCKLRSCLRRLWCAKKYAKGLCQSTDHTQQRRSAYHQHTNWNWKQDSWEGNGCRQHQVSSSKGAVSHQSGPDSLKKMNMHIQYKNNSILGVLAFTKMEAPRTEHP